MDRDVLAAWLAAGRSLEWIGREVGKPPSTVSYWARKFGLESRHREAHASRGGLDRETLEVLVAAHLTVRQIAERVERSPATVRHWLKRHGLETTRTARRSAKAAALAQRFKAVCQHHGAVEFVVRRDGTSACTKCRAEAVVAWRRSVKQRLIDDAGGACVLCGYARCPAALQFHHLDPAVKTFGIGSRGLGRSWKALTAEAGKCVLLCANCHAEVEAGVATLR